MATLEMLGFDDLDDAYKRIADIPWSVTSEALEEMAAIAKIEIKSSGESMGVRDPESNVHILDKIVSRKPKKTEFGGYANISFSGTRTRGRTKSRNAEIAFMNEYGKRGQPARPFIRTAMETHDEQISAPAERIVGDWIEKEFTR